MNQSCTSRSALLTGALLLVWCTSEGFAQGPTDSLKQQFGAAVAAYDAGNLAEARQRLEALEPQVPTSFELHELLGLTYGGLDQASRAVEELRRAVELRPDSAGARANLGTALVRAGHPREAEAEYRTALAHDATNAAATDDLARLLLGENRIAEALPFLESAHSRHPESEPVGYNLALAQLLTGHAEQARALVTTLQLGHDSGELHSLLGRIDEQEGKYVDAANELAAAGHMDPSEENLFAWASELLLHRAYEQAAAVFAQGTERYPKSPRLWVGLGMANYSHGQYQPAIQALLTAADLDPHDPRCYLFLSKAYLSDPSQADQVVARFRQYHELEPRNALAAYYAAMSQWKGHRVQAGEQANLGAVEALLEQSIALDGSNPEVHLQLGILYTDERAYDQALPEYQRALQLDPNLADAHFRLGRYYFRAGDKDKAESEFAVFKRLQAQHHAEVDKERAEVQQFVIASPTGAAAQPPGTNQP